METQLSDEDRIIRMLDEGKLTQEEADRLLNSIHAHQARDAALAKQLERRPGPQRGRLVSLLLLCGVFLVIGLVSSVLHYHQPDLSSVTESAGVTPLSTDQPEGRLIDLAGLTKERRTTMGNAKSFSASVFVVVIAAVVGVAILLIFNGLIDAREKVNAGWAQVENQYQRRLDLVPVLIDGVKTYMEHEHDTLTSLTEARANALGANDALAGRPPETEQQMRAVEASQGKVQSALARLFAVVENYPDLKASQNFLTLQDQIEGTENRIAVERRNYNEWSRRYNTKTMKFPSNVIANAVGFESKPYFQAETAALEGLKDPFGRSQQ
ncbi:MAG: LemA family protein [Gammaproteobacteria bacterium]|nr:LemA family protein [Gammaproteobacteria bacterium]